MADPFLPYDDTDAAVRDFVGMYGATLAATERAQAELLLQVASDRIRALLLPKTDADIDINAAQQVVFEVVRDAVKYGGLEMLSSFQNTTAHRTEAGAFDEAMKLVDDYLTDRHKRLLGIALRAGPVGSFPVCDY